MMRTMSEEASEENSEDLGSLARAGFAGARRNGPEDVSFAQMEVDIDLGSSLERLESGSNCIFDDTNDPSPLMNRLGAPLLPRNGVTEISLDGSQGSARRSDLSTVASQQGRARVVSSSLASKSTLIRRHSSQLSSLLGIRERGRLYMVRKCLSSKWLWPSLTLVVSLFGILIGGSCLVGTLSWFDSCSAVLIPSSLLLPFLYLLVTIFLFQPTQNQSLHEEFFSDALLEELLAGENILDVYTVTTRGAPLREACNVVVFLSGVGGVPEAWQTQVDAVVNAGFYALTIQMPGSGSLSAVKFSLPRAERVVRRVLDHEVFLSSGEAEDDVESSFQVAMMGEGSFHSTLSSSPPMDFRRKVVIVGWGLSCHVAMYLAASRRLGNSLLAGVALLGSPELPSTNTSWLTSLRYMSFRVPWIAEAARIAEYSGLPSDIKRVVGIESFHPEARADWGYSFIHHKSSLQIACSEYIGPVLAVSGKQHYLEQMQLSWGQTLEDPSSSAVESVYVRGLDSAGFRSSPKYNHSLLSKHLVQFASASFI